MAVSIKGSGGGKATLYIDDIKQDRDAVLNLYSIQDQVGYLIKDIPNLHDIKFMLFYYADMPTAEVEEL